MNNTPPDHEVQSEFLHQMYGVATGYAMLVLHKTDGFKREFPYQVPDQITEMAAKAVELAPQGNVYFGTTVRQEPNRQQSNPAIERVWLHLDLDEKFGDVESPEILEKIATLGALVVLSGTGKNKHVYVRLSRSVDEQTFNTLEASLQSWFGDGVDAKIRDNDILRIPGTINHKNGNPVELAEQYGYDASVSWTPDELLGMMPRVEPTNSVDAGSDTITPVPVAIPTSVAQVVAAPSTEQSDRMFRIGNACRGAGLTIEEAYWVLLQDKDQVARFERRGLNATYAELRKNWATSTSTPEPEKRAEAEKDWEVIVSEPKTETVTHSAWGDPGWDDFDFNAEPLMPNVLSRDDGVMLLYPGKTHTFMGESESGKSFLAQIACVQEMKKGNRILYIDFEASRREIFERFTELGVSQDIIKKLAVVLHPNGQLDPADAGWQQLLGQKFTVAVFDGVTEILSLHGLNPDKAEDIASFQRRIINPVADRTGAATITIDHQNKQRDNRGRFAAGSQHKMSGLTGVAYIVSPKESVAPGQIGSLRVQLGKDRDGQVAKHLGKRTGTARMVDAAVVTIDARVEGDIRYSIESPSIFVTPDLDPHQRAIVDLYAVLEADKTGGLTASEWKSEVPCNATVKSKAATQMLAAGYAVKISKKNPDTNRTQKYIIAGERPVFNTKQSLEDDRELLEGDM